MSERTSYAPGTPSWIDLGTPDQDGAAEFYGSLFGWEVPESENPEETGGYRIATLREKAIGGVMRLMQEGQPPAWSTYVAVEDAGATVAAAKGAGGNVVVEPMDVLELGRMAFLSDPTGAVIGIWQPKSFAGAGLVNEPGAFGWSELNTRDPGAARAFYEAVFGWSSEDREMGEAGTYTEFKLGGHPVAGMIDITGRVPEKVPAHWLAYFTVQSTDATVEKLKASGGSVMFGPIDITAGRLDFPAGRIAVVADPYGAPFGVNQMPEGAVGP
jgi:predicted enzyme related to lactoylglutathione lyase